MQRSVTFTAWESFTLQGIRFIAFELDGHKHIYDAHNRNYGAYLTLDSFRKMARKMQYGVKALCLDVVS